MSTTLIVCVCFCVCFCAAIFIYFFLCLGKKEDNSNTNQTTDKDKQFIKSFSQREELVNNFLKQNFCNYKQCEILITLGINNFVSPIAKIDKDNSILTLNFEELSNNYINCFTRKQAFDFLKINYNIFVTSFYDTNHKMNDDKIYVAHIKSNKTKINISLNAKTFHDAESKLIDKLIDLSLNEKF